MRVVLIILLVLVVIFVLAGVLGGRRHKKQLEALAPEDRARHAQCLEADKIIKDLERSHQSQVHQAQKAVRAAERVDKLIKLPTAWVSPIEVHVQGTTHPLTPSTSASMEERGTTTSHVVDKRIKSKNQAHGIGVAVGARGTHLAGGVGGGKSRGKGSTKIEHAVVKTDDREIYVTVTDTTWSDVFQVDPGNGEKARRFVAAVNSAAANVVAFKEHRDAKVQGVRRALAVAEGDTEALEQARATREALGPDPLKQLQKAR